MLSVRKLVLSRASERQGCSQQSCPFHPHGWLRVSFRLHYSFFIVNYKLKHIVILLYFDLILLLLFTPFIIFVSFGWILCPVITCLWVILVLLQWQHRSFSCLVVTTWVLGLNCDVNLGLCSRLFLMIFYVFGYMGIRVCGYVGMWFMGTMCFFVGPLVFDVFLYICKRKLPPWLS